MTITKDNGNSCLIYCVLHLFQHKAVAFMEEDGRYMSYLLF